MVATNMIASVILFLGSIVYFFAIIYAIKRYLQLNDKKDWERTKQSETMMYQAIDEWKKTHEI